MKKLGGRIPELDGIRAVAIVAVILSHLTYVRTLGGWMGDQMGEECACGLLGGILRYKAALEGGIEGRPENNDTPV